jgi:Ca-activated chloride channel family protein
MIFRPYFSAILIAAAALASPALADKAILVLDGSGSMWGQIEGRTKIEIARDTVGDLLNGWPAVTELGVIAYGHREKANCADIETLAPLGAVDAARIGGVVEALNPKGKTPIAAALRQAAEELRSTEEKAMVILVSDGLETCDADPCAAAAELEAAGIDFTAHVVGFGTTAEENQQLQCIADNTGGKFLEASNASELQTAMVEVKQEVAEPKQTVVKVQKVEANSGTLVLVNAKSGADILDAAGSKVGSACTGCGSEQLPIGTYSLEGEGFELSNVEIKPGEELVIDVGG